MHKSKIGNKNILLANKGKFVRVIILQPQFLFITPHYKHSLKYILIRAIILQVRYIVIGKSLNKIKFIKVKRESIGRLYLSIRST